MEAFTRDGSPHRAELFGINESFLNAYVYDIDVAKITSVKYLPRDKKGNIYATY